MALFGKKDLAFVLPDDQPGDPVSLRHTQTSEATEQFQELKPKVDASAKVRRYRAGQVPSFAAGYEEERGFVTAGNRVRTALQTPAQAKSTSASSSSSGRQRIEAQVIKAQPKAAPSGDIRGSRRADSSDESDAGNALDDSSSEDEEEVDRRRQALRQKMLEKESKQQSGSGDNAAFETKARRPVVEAKVVRAAVEPKPQVVAESSSSDSSSSEYETDTDDSEEEQVLMKPVFVPKKARETIKRQEELEADEEKRRLAEEAKANARKAEARKLVVEELQREKEATHASDATDTEMPDDTDGLDPEQEYHDWELREMRRIKRVRDRREQRRLEAEETLRRRNMTDEERQAEDEKLKNQPKEKAKLKFLQKYYHKGAFYMDEDSIRDKADVRLREATGATLEDNFNKEVLPAVLQVKNFGKSGRTKYTHLAAEDTSRKDSFWGRNDAVREKFSSRLSGTRELDAPSKKRKTDP